ncbi:unnamed protein product [Amoebophrya sp. A25]|nr:unnamed protein product [Amoebophrya sp. A25]|eukprot:GSA25T00016996001.1
MEKSLGEERILYQHEAGRVGAGFQMQGIGEDSSDLRRKKEANAFFRRFQKFQDSNYIQKTPGPMMEGKREGLKNLSSQQLSNLSVSTYFRSCESLGTVPKVPKSIILDAKNDEEGVLSSRVDLEALDMTDTDLEAYQKAIFSEIPILLEKNKVTRKPEKNDVLQLLPAVKIKVLRMGRNRFSDRGLAKFLAGFVQLGKGPKKVFELEEINLQGLTMFSGLSIAKLSAMMGEPQSFPRIVTLNLSGISTLFTQHDHCKLLCENLVKVGTLQELKIADTGLGLVSQATVVLLVQGLGDLLAIKNLDLSSNFIGKDGFVALGKYCEDAQLHELSLNWNSDKPNSYMPPPVYIPPTEDGAPPPPPPKEEAEDEAICYFLEKLNFQNRMEYLSLRGSGLSYAADLVLCEALECNINLVQFDASDNAHGKDGLRCLLRLLISPECGVANLSVAQVREKYYAPGEQFRYNFTDPNGAYSLRLDRPSDRATLKLLHRCAWYFNVKEAAFVDMTLDGASCALPVSEKQTDRGRAYQFTQERGRLNFVFVLDDKPFQEELKKQQGKSPKKGSDEHSLMAPSPAKKAPGGPASGKNVSTLLDYSKLKATLLRFVPLAVLYQNLQSDKEKGVLLEAMAFDMKMKLCHVQFFIEKAPLMTPFIIKTLYSTVHRAEAMQLVSLLPHPSLQRAVRAATSNAVFFNADNPTGRYKLSIENPTDKNMADTLIRLSSWEKQLQEQEDMPEEIKDASQYGDRTCLRNVVLNGKPYRPEELGSDVLQGAIGTLEMDYRTRIFTEQGTSLIQPRTHSLLWRELMDKLFDSDISTLGKVRCFRQISSHLSIDYRQLKEFVLFFARAPKDTNWYSNDQRNAEEIEAADPRVVGGIFVDSDAATYLRSEAFLTLWSRCRDPNSVVMTNTGEFRAIPDTEDDGLLYDPRVFCRAEQRAIVSTLGWLTCLDVRRICDPETNFGGFFELDLGIHEEWVVARIIISLASMEDGDNLINPHWTGARQSTIGGFHVPITWIEELPEFGIFTCQYVHEEPSYVDPEARKELIAKYLPEFEDLIAWRKDEEGKKLVPPSEP